MQVANQKQSHDNHAIEKGCAGGRAAELIISQSLSTKQRLGNQVHSRQQDYTQDMSVLRFRMGSVSQAKG